MDKREEAELPVCGDRLLEKGKMRRRPFEPEQKMCNASRRIKKDKGKREVRMVTELRMARSD